MAIVYQRLKDYELPEYCVVKLKEMGNIYELSYSEHKNSFCAIRLIDKDHYVKIDYDTGEISDAYECNHIKNRSESIFQVGQSLKRLRDLINTNVVDPTHWKWITLTYGDNMTDTVKLYRDFQKFMQKIRYQYNQYNIEYIVCCEPQGRGAWHMHLLLDFGTKAPYIHNDTIWKLWSPKGFANDRDYTKTKDLDDIDNVGAYLTAYLGDMELTEENLHSLAQTSPEMAKNVLKGNVEIKEVIDNMDCIKQYIKGARLYMYPPKFNIYRCSRGIKKPTEQYMHIEVAKKKIGRLKPTYTTSIHLEDLDNHYNNTYHYEYYNIKRTQDKVSSVKV